MHGDEWVLTKRGERLLRAVEWVAYAAVAAALLMLMGFAGWIETRG